MNSSESTPGNIDEDTFYDSSPLEPYLLYQAEILTNVPILRMPWEEMGCRWLLLRAARTARPLHEALQHGSTPGTVRVLDSNQSSIEWQTNDRGDYALGVLDKTPVLVLNQTCDVQNKQFLQVAPIFPLDKADVDDAEEFEKLKQGHRYSAFWIKRHMPEIPTESYADLELIQAVHTSYINRIRPNEHFRLNGAKTRLLQRRITRYFGRANSFDARVESAPAPGTYLCTKCYFDFGRATPVQLSEGAPLPECTECHGTDWVLQGR